MPAGALKLAPTLMLPLLWPLVEKKRSPPPSGAPRRVPTLVVPAAWLLHPRSGCWGFDANRAWRPDQAPCRAWKGRVVKER